MNCLIFSKKSNSLIVFEQKTMTVNIGHAFSEAIQLFFQNLSEFTQIVTRFFI